MTAVADDIWAILREVAQSQKDTDRKFQETDRLIKDLREQSKETERMFQDTDRKFQDTDRKMQDTDRKIKEVTTSIGKLGNRLGDFIEDAVRPSAVRLFRERGVDVHEVHQNVSAQREGGGIEVDLLVVNDMDVVAIECKSNLKQEDVDEHLQRLGKLKKLLPKYADSRVMGALAALVIPEQVARYAYRHGLYVIGQSGDHLEIRNDANFAPGVW